MSKYHCFTFLLGYVKLWEDIHWCRFNEVLVLSYPKAVSICSLWNDIDLLMGKLSAHSPDTIPQRQNSYPLFPVYIIPLWIRARCWHTKLHLSTLLWHFIGTLPKKFQITFTLSEAATQGMCGILLLQRGTDIFLWYFTARHPEESELCDTKESQNLCWCKWA